MRVEGGETVLFQEPRRHPPGDLLEADLRGRGPGKGTTEPTQQRGCDQLVVVALWLSGR
jgi:hypothetical protein